MNSEMYGIVVEAYRVQTRAPLCANKILVWSWSFPAVQDISPSTNSSYHTTYIPSLKPAIYVVIRKTEMIPVGLKRKWEDTEYDSDDDEPTFGKQILPVANLPMNFDREPEDGLEYLFTVR